MATPTPPPQDATPTEVRSWFITLLCDLHAVPENEAKEIASKWRLGRGSELIYYDVDTFRNIFGGEEGTILFGHARGELQTDKKGPTGSMKALKKDIFGLTPGCELSCPGHGFWVLLIKVKWPLFIFSSF
jgi:hypothetical protein